MMRTLDAIVGALSDAVILGTYTLIGLFVYACYTGHIVIASGANHVMVLIK